ncbi:hypothetical protein LDENG_00139890 [Lucifuga dentata]|nr:hypothetical protein LDENG_00139890 [Lucifuga dentata]
MALSDMGVKVFAGVLNIDGAGAEQLRKRQCENLHILQLDVMNNSQIKQVHRYICDQVGEAGLWGLVNNAGILSYPMDAELHPIKIFKHLLDVNFLGPVKMCKTFLPLLRRSKGRIVNVTSVEGEVPMISFSAFGGSKAALSFFSKVTRMELAPWGIKVAIVQLLGFKTNTFGNISINRSINNNKEEVLGTISSEARKDYGEEYISCICNCLDKMSNNFSEDLRSAVDDICHALLSAEPELQYMPGWQGWLLHFIHDLCPASLFDIISMRLKLFDCKPAGLKMR